jgi:regulator of sirC expression with transglutaminase-like and TPR domain
MFWCLDGDEAMERGDYIRALDSYTKAIGLSEDSGFFRCRGVAFKQLKHLEDALKDSI